MTLSEKFKAYCNENITQVVTPLTDLEKQDILKSLQASPFKSVVQAYTVLDFYNYEHHIAEGFDIYFGYNNNQMSAESILEMVHPEDQEAFGTLYYLCLEGLMNMPIATKGIGHFCINYRIKDAFGNYHKVIETNNIIASDKATNRPIVNLAQMTLLPKNSHSNKVNYYFNIKDEQGSVEIMQSYLGVYDSKLNIFTQNEIKIAHLLKLGMTSMSIADKMFLSKHTIDKYRKDMLSKTQTVNTPQLITYLEQIGIL